MQISSIKNKADTQLELFDIGDNASKKTQNNNSTFQDPSFSYNKIQPVHRWVPWIAGFSSNFVQDILTKYIKHKGVVLDPFSGVGTTLVEAILLGHQAIGFEINPYAALACRAKLNAYKVAYQELETEITRFEVFYHERANGDYTPQSTAPQGFKTRSAFYSPKVLRKVLITWDFINTITEPAIQELFRLSFAATMVKYSNYSYEPSLGRRVSAGKSEIHDYPVGQAILDKLTDMLKDIYWLQQKLPQQPSAKVYNDSFFNYSEYLTPESVDLVITSPPYLNNYHYNRNTRPQLYWLQYATQPKDLKSLERSNFGKYWQTVREKEHLELKFTLPNTDLEERLQILRQLKPEKGVYGGNGWANYAATYFNDCYTFAKAINYILKPNSTALVVIGNSILQGIMIPTDYYFGKIAESIGLELVNIETPRATRVGNSIIQSDVRVVKAKKSHHLYEAIVELRKSATS
ncbi:MAG: site-specific DNA-methyltransferase [Anaerolineae bacterium]|nr:site-specific DNA-methyltransferase [Anaerolineae bacterium]